MNINRRQLSRPMWALLLLGAAIGSGSALAAGKTGATGTTDAAARYQQERAVCLSGQSSQDRATCLREAGAAFAEAKRGALDDGSAAHERNARERCNKLAEADRNAERSPRARRLPEESYNAIGRARPGSAASPTALKIAAP